MSNRNEVEMLEFIGREKSATGQTTIADTWNEASRVAEEKIRASSLTSSALEPIAEEMQYIASGIQSWTPAGIADKLKGWAATLSKVVDPAPAAPAEPIAPDVT